MSWLRASAAGALCSVSVLGLLEGAPCGNWGSGSKADLELCVLKGKCWLWRRVERGGSAGGWSKFRLVERGGGAGGRSLRRRGGSAGGRSLGLLAMALR